MFGTFFLFFKALYSYTSIGFHFKRSCKLLSSSLIRFIHKQKYHLLTGDSKSKMVCEQVVPDSSSSILDEDEEAKVTMVAPPPPIKKRRVNFCLTLDLGGDSNGRKSGGNKEDRVPDSQGYPDEFFVPTTPGGKPQVTTENRDDREQANCGVPALLTCSVRQV